MAVNLSIKNVPDELAERLRANAKRHHRSLQGELMYLLETGLQREEPISVDELLRRVRGRGTVTAAEAAEQIRAERDAR